jgi:adenosine deaminase
VTLRDLPKVELHRHLEGSVRYETWREIAKAAGVEVVPRSKYVVGRREAKTLPSFLSHFRLLHNLYPDRDSIERVAREAVEDARRDHVVYLELRFSPVHFARRMKADAVKVAGWIIDAARRAAGRRLQVRFLVTFGRDFDRATNEPSLSAALEHRGEVVGVDIAGDETKPARHLEPLVRKAQRAGLKLTVHAGEGAGGESVREAIEALGADRIGHGVRAIGDPRVLSLATEHAVAFEMCPTSNAQTGACPLSRHPLRSLLRAGQAVTINTDDPALSDIDLTHEFEVATNRLGLTAADLALAVDNASRAAFDEDWKEKRP